MAGHGMTGGGLLAQNYTALTGSSNVQALVLISSFLQRTVRLNGVQSLFHRLSLDFPPFSFHGVAQFRPDISACVPKASIQPSFSLTCPLGCLQDGLLDFITTNLWFSHLSGHSHWQFNHVDIACSTLNPSFHQSHSFLICAFRLFICCFSPKFIHIIRCAHVHGYQRTILPRPCADSGRRFGRCGARHTTGGELPSCPALVAGEQRNLCIQIIKNDFKDNKHLIWSSEYFVFFFIVFHESKFFFALRALMTQTLHYFHH